MIAIIQYDAGNILSVKNALERIGAEYILTDDTEKILSCDRVILPGVGHAGKAMASLRERGLDTLIPKLTTPTLGICIGMQLLCRHSDEGDTPCLGVFPCDVERFPIEEGLKVPHMGWDTLSPLSSHPLLSGIDSRDWVYYVHSYFGTVCPSTIATTSYGGTTFSSVLARDNFMGVQWHPEKSAGVGERLLGNFLSL